MFDILINVLVSLFFRFHVSQQCQCQGRNICFTYPNMCSDITSAAILLLSDSLLSIIARLQTSCLNRPTRHEMQQVLCALIQQDLFLQKDYFKVNNSGAGKTFMTSEPSQTIMVIVLVYFCDITFFNTQSMSRLT